MDDAGFYHKKVKYVDTDGVEHTGWIDAYCSAYDNDDGNAGMCFIDDEGSLPYICENEIEYIEMID